MNTYSQNIENKYKIDKDYALKILDSLELPFSLTDAQKRVINDIINDFSSDRVSRRLVQGDVGTGKTIVAMIASLIMAKNGYQSSLMAPTELLATQHYNNFKKIMKDLKVELLTSKIKGKKREQILDLLKRGEIDVLVGTHSLLNDNVEFKNLALIVIDEQHKFGVLQRLRLYSKSSSPHLIVMSATPIPRTLALTVYSDLDISIIDKGPPGRKKAITEIFNYKDINKVFSFIEKQLEEGRQVFVVCPSIYDNPKLEIKNVQEVYEQFKERFKSYHVSYLHGKMSSKEKDKIMESFRDNEIAILITTTVVEVGIDVPNANTIVILDSERFGLSQLHQLRGRVKRSNHQPYCLLITSKNLSLGDYNKSLQRLNILKYYDDGFSVAEKDLELRGPGEVLGYKQHGFTEFKALDPIKDINLIKKSNELAKKLVNFIDKSEFFKRKIEAIKLHQDDLVDIGGMV